MHEPSAPAPPAETRDKRQAQRERLGLLFVGAAIVMLAVAFAWPWRPSNVPALADRDRFSPVGHGDGRLYVRRSAAGAPEAWISENAAAIPALVALGGDIPPEIRDSLIAIIPDMYDLGRYPTGTQLYRVRARTLVAEGSVEVLDSYVLRHTTGDYLLGMVNPADQTIVDYVPPLLQLPADLTSINTVTQTGIVVSQYPYTASVAVKEAPTDDDRPCRKVESMQTIGLPSGEPVIDDVVMTLCAELGATRATAYVDGRPDRDILAVGSTSLRAELSPPTARLGPAPPAPMPQASWVLTSFAQAEAWYPTPATTPAIFVPGPTPFVLVAVRGGVLSAISSQEPQSVLWSWQSGGDIFSTPAVDLATGRLYFGSTDRRVTALTLDGLFLWQQRANDNIAASPLPVDDLVIVPSEDANLYAFDAITGALRWTQPLDGSSVARPVLVQPAANPWLVSATDSGTVTAHRVVDGSVVWTAQVDDAVAAGLIAVDDLVIVAEVGGAVNALDQGSGQERWTTTLGWPIRFAPAVGASTLYFHDENGTLVALDTATGRVLWQDKNRSYAGSPLVIGGGPSAGGEYVLSNASNGSVHRHTREGIRDLAWSSPATALDATIDFTFGLTPGDGAYWLMDSNRTLWRLGP